MGGIGCKLLATAAMGACMTVLPASCRAADATPAEAASMEAQVRQALGQLFGPALNLSERPVHVTADGDHYDIDVPFPVAAALDPGADTATPSPSPSPSGPLLRPKQVYDISGDARPGDHGTWTVEDVRVTSPIRFTAKMPVPPKPGQPAVPGATEPVTYTVEQTGQNGRILWDPSFSTASTWTMSSQKSTITADGASIKLNATIGPTNSVTTLQPNGADRTDVLLDVTSQDYRSDINGANGDVKLGMAQLHVTGAMNNINRENAARLMRSITALLASGAPKGSPALTPLVKAVLVPLQDLASSMRLDEGMDGFAMQAAGQDVTVDHLRIGVDAKSEAGLLQAGMDLGMQGISLPNVPLGPFAALLPDRIEVRPVLGGVAAADLLHMADLEADKVEPTQADIAALFSHGGVTGGLESMTVEVGGATFTGQGSVMASAPTAQAVTGSGTITGRNFDLLMQKVSALPNMGQQALPVMVFIKGIGRNVGDTLVWDITYKDQHVLVNNVDLTAMAGARTAAPRPAAPAAPGALVKPAPKPAVPGQVPSWAK